ncbi:M48 family metalloprotease [Limnohabitans sp. 15K]|uniref:M48 family metalloprotease n=1 Tax=Limnohabitans sp. 15K TaxID=1100706 RepID=UPI000C1EBBC2|nr:M48 family metalloprotease [Limnohabitans sp. 15K]PIT83516.1 peptidase M48 [Limnohabitans sp. 15K]
MKTKTLKPLLRSPKWVLTVLVCALGMQPAWTQNNALPTLGNSEGISLGAERKLGDRIARELYRDPDYLEDPVLDEYIQRLWAPLVKAAVARGELSPELQERFAWRILLGRDRSVNAFALPGGYLGVHLGLIAVVSSNDELASVLAHELSHVTQRHIARSMDEQGKMTPLLIGSMILGALAISKNPQAATGLMVGGQAAAIQSQLRYSRDMEREADRVGFGVLADAGYDTQGFVGMFAKLQQAAGVNDNGAFPYLRSHPLTTERIADMQSRLQLNNSTARPSTDLAQAMMAARARAMSQNSPEALKAWTQDGKATSAQATPAQKAGALYAATLAHLQLRNASEAERTATALSGVVSSLVLPNAPQSDALRLVTLLQAEVAAKNDRFAQALKTLESLNHTTLPRPELMATAEAFLRLPEQPGRTKITQLLREQVTLNPHDAQAWNTLARLLAMQGQMLASLRAEGEAQMARMDWSGAVDRFRAAQDWAKNNRLQAGDHIEASIVDARLRQTQALVREMQTER